MPAKRGRDHNRYRHGHSLWKNRSAVYRRWTDMLSRCHNKNVLSYPRYGGRGIKVCERWLDFVNFLTDMGEPPTPKHKLERINNNGNYEPGNCRWATSKEQASNRSSSRLLTYQGRTQTLQAWADELGLSHSTISMRLTQYSWSVEKTLGTPARPWGPGKKKSVPAG